ncbi:MAG TPA: hypothetical protein VMI06_16485 [Terriglobia bacterium]|nr:hypothetical protein [Terriglobia bacterium]
MWYENPGIVVPLGVFGMTIVIVAISVGFGSMRKIRERELLAHQDLRTREMDHELKLKELEVEKTRLELEKARLSKSGDPVPR